MKPCALVTFAHLPSKLLLVICYRLCHEPSSSWHLRTAEPPKVKSLMSDLRQQVIAPPQGWKPLDVAELWRFRSLLNIFVWRDLKVRYKQSALGLTWVVLQPLALTIVYSVFFGYIARIPSEGVPYPVFFLGGMILWQFFSNTLMQGAISLTSQQALITKIYFPRALAPLSVVVSSLVDFGVMFLLLIGVMAFYRVAPTAGIVYAPFFALMAALLAFAVCLWLSAIDAMYRDARYALAFIVQLWYFGTPIIYPLSLVPEKWRFIFLFNPMAAFVMGFRWAMLGDTAPPQMRLIVSGVAVTLILLITGAFFFRRVEQRVVDVI